MVPFGALWSPVSKNSNVISKFKEFLFSCSFKLRWIVTNAMTCPIAKFCFSYGLFWLGHVAGLFLAAVHVSISVAWFCLSIPTPVSHIARNWWTRTQTIQTKLWWSTKTPREISVGAIVGGRGSRDRSDGGGKWQTESGNGDVNRLLRSVHLDSRGPIKTRRNKRSIGKHFPS